MAVDTTLAWDEMTAGDQLGPIEYEITPSLHEAFLAGINSPATVAGSLVDDEGRPVAHPLQTLTDYLALIQDRYAPMGTGLHTRHRTGMVRPIPLETPLVAQGSVTETYVKRGRDYWVADYTVSDESGVLVRHQMTATVDRPDGLDTSTRPADASVTTPPRATAAEAVEWTRSRSHTMTLPMIVDYDDQYWLRFGEAFRNAPNAHTSPEIAQASGLPDAVVHASHYYCWFADVALLTFGPRWMYGGTLEGRFVSPAFPGDTIHVETANQHDALLLRATGAVGQSPFAVGSASYANATV